MSEATESTPDNDMLTHMWEMQTALNQRIGVDTTELTDEERVTWILNYCRAMTQELAELTDSVPWKWWAKYQEFDKQNAIVEIVDIWHFLMSAAQVMGLTAEDFYEVYLQKNKVNHKRQDTGYTEKDESDNENIGAK